MTEPRSELIVDVEMRAVVTIRARGDIDLDTSAAFRAAVEDAVAAQPPGGLVLDLAGVDFMDSSGLAILINAENSGIAVRVGEASPSALVVIKATGLQHLLGDDR